MVLVCVYGFWHFTAASGPWCIPQGKGTHLRLKDRDQTASSLFCLQTKLFSLPLSPVLFSPFSFTPQSYLNGKKRTKTQPQWWQRQQHRWVRILQVLASLCLASRDIVGWMTAAKEITRKKESIAIEELSVVSRAALSRYVLKYGLACDMRSKSSQERPR